MGRKLKKDNARRRNAAMGRDNIEKRHEVQKRELREQLAVQVANMEQLRELSEEIKLENEHLKAENGIIKREIDLKKSEINSIHVEISAERKKITDNNNEITMISDKLKETQRSEEFFNNQASTLRKANFELQNEKKEVLSELVQMRKTQSATISTKVQAQVRVFDMTQRKKMEELENRIATLVANSPTGGSSLKPFKKGNRKETTDSRCEKALECLKKSVGEDEFDDFLKSLIIYISKNPMYTFSLVLNAVDSFFATVKFKLSDGFLKDFKSFLTKKLGFDIFASRQKIEILKKKHSANENYKFTVKSVMRKVGSREVAVDTVHIEAHDVEKLIVRRVECQSECGNLIIDQNEPLLLGLGGDKGGSTTKLLIVFGNLKNPNNPHGVLLIGSYEGSDDYKSLKENFANLFHKLNSLKTITYMENGKSVTRTVQKFAIGDCKYLSSVIGHSGQSCSTPCFICKLAWVNRGKNAARVGSFNFSQVGDPYSSNDLKEPLLLVEPGSLCPPALHTILGIVQEYVLNWLFGLCNAIDSEDLLAEDLKEQRKTLLNLIDQEEFYTSRYISTKKTFETAQKLLDVIEKSSKSRRSTKRVTVEPCDSDFCFFSHAKKQSLPKCDIFRCSGCQRHLHEVCAFVVTSEETERHKVNPMKCVQCRRQNKPLSHVDRTKILEKILICAEKDMKNDEDVLADVMNEKEALEDILDKSAGPTRRKLEEVLRSIRCDPRAFYQQLTGNQARRILRCENIEKILAVFPDGSSENLEIMRNVMLDLGGIMSSANNEYKTDEQIDDIERLIFSFEKNLKEAQPNATVTPKLHLICAHVIPYLRIYRSWGHVTEQGIESFHPLVNSLEVRFSSVRDLLLKGNLIVQHLSNYNFLADCGDSWFENS